MSKDNVQDIKIYTNKLHLFATRSLIGTISNHLTWEWPSKGSKFTISLDCPKDELLSPTVLILVATSIGNDVAWLKDQGYEVEFELTNF